jgi:hypothetical protein
MAVKSITITNGQTLFDIALRYYGDVSKAVDIIKLNDNITDLIFNKLEGLTILVDEQNNDIVNYYNSGDVKFATRYPETISGAAFDLEFSLAFF